MSSPIMTLNKIIQASVGADLLALLEGVWQNVDQQAASDSISKRAKAYPARILQLSTMEKNGEEASRWALLVMAKLPLAAE